MKFTSINQFKQYLIAEGHMSFDGGTATPATKKSPAFTITGYEWADEEEEEENPVELSGETLMQILTTNLETSNDADDFIEKVATHITTSGENKLSAEDELKLMTWYMEQQGEETGNDADGDIDELIEQINALDIFIHEHSTDGIVVKKFNQVIDKYVGEYNPEKQDGVPLRDTIADASLSTQELKSIIAELTEIKNSMKNTNSESTTGSEPVEIHLDTETLYDVKVWWAPDSKEDNEHFERAEGTQQGEEGWYWALKLNYIGEEHYVYTFTDKLNQQFNHHNDYSIDIDGADLKTDVRFHDSKKPVTDQLAPEENNEPQYAIDKVIAYLGEEFGLDDSAHEGDIKTAMADLGIKHEDYFTIKQDLEDKGWIIEPEL